MNPIIELIINVKNGYMSRKEAISMTHSKYKQVVAEKLKELGFIGDIVIEGEIKKTMKIQLKYIEGEPVLTGVQIHSKAGKREYCTYKKLKRVLGGMGYSFLSTPKGVMTDKESKKNKLGGELLFSIW